MTESSERNAAIRRTTRETDIDLRLGVDGSGQASVRTGVGFMDHMLTLFAVHGLFDLEIAATGDIEVDDHHTVEDVGISLGMAFAQALGRALHRPALLPLPGLLLKVGLGELSGLLLGGQKALPQRALAAGYEFRFTAIDTALADLFKDAA